MDADRTFFKINSVFCFYVGLSFIGKVIGDWRSGMAGDLANQDLDKFMDLILRHFAQQSFYFAVFAGNIPALMLISLMVSFFLYLHDRSRPISLVALVFGTAMGAVWIARRLFGTAVTLVASRYMSETSPVARQDLALQAKSLYYYDSFGSLLSSNTSLIAYALIGFLFTRGMGLEYAVGVLFLGSSISLLAFQFMKPASWFIEAAGVLILPALAFILSGILLWRYKPSVEPWARETTPVLDSESWAEEAGSPGEWMEEAGSPGEWTDEAKPASDPKVDELLTEASPKAP